MDVTNSTKATKMLKPGQSQTKTKEVEELGVRMANDFSRFFFLFASPPRNSPSRWRHQPPARPPRTPRSDPRSPSTAGRRGAGPHRTAPGPAPSPPPPPLQKRPPGRLPPRFCPLPRNLRGSRSLAGPPRMGGCPGHALLPAGGAARLRRPAAGRCGKVPPRQAGECCGRTGTPAAARPGVPRLFPPPVSAGAGAALRRGFPRRGAGGGCGGTAGAPRGPAGS